MDMLRHLEKFLPEDRLKVFLHLAPPVYLISVIYFYADRGLFLDPDHGLVLIADYFCYWLAAVTGLSGTPLDVYDNAAFMGHGAAFFEAEGYLPFMYPPTYLLTILPLGLFPAWLSHILFFALTLAALAYVGRLIWGNWNGALIVCAFPAVLGVLIHGQNSFLSAAVLGGALAALRSGRFVLAGILIGCLTFKPQVGFLIPFALLAGRYWTTFAVAGVTTVLFAAFATSAFGWEIWPAFLEQTRFASSLLNEEYVAYWKYLSPYAGLRMLEVPNGVAMTMQVAVSLLCLVWIVRLWSGKAPFGIKAAALVSAGLLTSPYMLTYEYILLVLPMLLLWRMVREAGFHSFDMLLYVIVLALILSARLIADHTGIPLSVAPALITLFMTHRYWLRWRREQDGVLEVVTPIAGSPAHGG